MSRWKFILSLSVIAFELFALCHCKEMEMEMDLKASELSHLRMGF